jgi:phenylacetate-coenzyme A ligase PaaK-like adenylate-forming protein
MDLAYQRKRFADMAAALRLSRELAEHASWSRDRLDALRRDRLDTLVRHAFAASPFYAERFAGLVGPGPVELSSLPILDKTTMMDRFDDLVTDRRLRRDRLVAHLDGLDHDALLLGEHRVMTTSGSSGSKALFVYDREAWRGIIAQVLIHSDTAGVRPRLPRLKMAIVGGGAPTHMSRRCAATLAIGIHKVMALAVTQPIPDLVERLNAFQPDFLNAYPSVAVLLAGEQEEGRLRIAPEIVTTSSEVRTPEMTARIERAFGVRPFEMYATTEGAFGFSCEEGHGFHFNETMTIVENVDDDARPVPPGEPGARLLVTNLFNRVQPLIRFEVSDVVRFDPEPCPCGRTAALVRTIEGRADDVLYLPGETRARVPVHPMQFDVVTADRAVREFQVVQEGDSLRLRVALRGDVATSDATARLRDAVATRLTTLGVRDPDVRVETCPGIERPPSGKVQIVQGPASSASASSVRSTSASVV